MTDSLPENVTRLLLVEGREDQEFFIQLGKHLNYDTDKWPLQIIKCDGKGGLQARLRTLMKPDTMKEVQRIGIARDADFNTDALQSVQSAIWNANQRNDFKLVIPQSVMGPTPGKPSVTVLILPSGEREGMLEDLVLDAFQHDPVTSCVDEYFKCLGDSGIKTLPNRLPKARLRAFITGKNVSEEATSSDKDRSYLSGIFHMSWLTDDFWDNPAFKDARTFLTQLLD